MNNILEQSESGREIARRNLEEGIERGNINSMRLLLQARFGDIADLDVLARHLATADHAGNVSRIVAGAALDDLRS